MRSGIKAAKVLYDIAMYRADDLLSPFRPATFSYTTRDEGDTLREGEDMRNLIRNIRLQTFIAQHFRACDDTYAGGQATSSAYQRQGYSPSGVSQTPC